MHTVRFVRLWKWGSQKSSLDQQVQIKMVFICGRILRSGQLTSSQQSHGNRNDDYTHTTFTNLPNFTVAGL